jgi:uncharacterized protein YqgC (DUF456 family)
VDPVVIVSAVLVVLGLVGVVVPFLPGSGLVVLGVLVWAVDTGTAVAWLVLGAAAVLVLAGAVAKYAVPGRRLRTSGVPTSTMLLGAAVGVVGFFVVPVVGLPLGFVLGVYLAEWRRLTDPALAWPATVATVKAVGLGMLIEFVAALLAAAAWVVGLVAA